MSCVVARLLVSLRKDKDKKVREMIFPDFFFFGFSMLFVEIIIV